MMIRLLLAVVTAGILLTIATSVSAQTRRFALVIGANIGDDDEEPLRFAEQDARRVADVLQDLGGVAQDNMVLLLGPNAQTVTHTMHALRDEIASHAGESILFVYYSGHADARSVHLGGTRLGFSELKTLVEDAPATVKVVVVDACQAGDLTRVKGGAPAEPFELDAAQWQSGSGLAILTSAASGEDAQESDRLQGSFFTHHLISGMMGAADASKDGVVTLSEAYEYAYAETLRSTSRARFVQHPTYAFDMRGRRDLPLTRITANPQVGRLTLEGDGTYVLFGTKTSRSVVAEVRVEDRVELAVLPGTYLVRRRHRGRIYEGEARVAPNSRATLAAGDLRAIPVSQVARKGTDAQTPRAWGLTAGGGYSGEVLASTGGIAQGVLGMQLDMRPITLQVRARYGQASASQSAIPMAHNLGGVDVSALSVFDVGRFFVGLGPRLGADLMVQSFPQDDEATRRALLGRLSVVGVAGWALTSRISAYVEPSGDAYFMRRVQGLDGQEQMSIEFAPSVVGGVMFSL